MHKNNQSVDIDNFLVLSSKIYTPNIRIIFHQGNEEADRSVYKAYRGKVLITNQAILLPKSQIDQMEEKLRS